MVVRLNDLAALHQARVEWTPALAHLREGLQLSEHHGLAFVRPHLMVNLALVSFFDGRLDEAEQIGRQVLDESRAAANRQVEADWVNCGLCVDERGAGDAIAGVRRGSPADLWSLAEGSHNTLVIPTRD